MPTPWLKRIRKTGQLTVFNNAGAWSAAVDSAMTTFNNLAVGVKLVSEKEEKSANIVVRLPATSRLPGARRCRSLPGSDSRRRCI